MSKGLESLEYKEALVNFGKMLPAIDDVYAYSEGEIDKVEGEKAVEKGKEILKEWDRLMGVMSDIQKGELKSLYEGDVESLKGFLSKVK